MFARRRLIVAVAAALLALFLATYGTARARQSSAVPSQFRAMTAARTSARLAVQWAQRDGLPPHRVAGLQARLEQLGLTPVPGASLLWDGRPTFYQNQTRGYRQIRADVRVALRVATAQVRRQLKTQIATTGADVNRAGAIDLDTSATRKVLALVSTAVRGRHTLLWLERTDSHVMGIDLGLEHAITQRNGEIAAILQQARGSSAGIAAEAKATAETATGQAGMIALLQPRGRQEWAGIDRDLRAVGTQRSARQAAIAYLALQHDAHAVAADFARTVPAKLILVSTEKQWAWVYQDGKVVYNTPVTSGGPELPTDHGVFHILDKVSPFVFHSPFPPSSPYYYLPSPVTYWMPFDSDQQGLHDAPWRSYFGPGSNLAPTDLGTGNFIEGTHGCVNLPFAAAQFIWDFAPIGTTVVVR